MKGLILTCSVIGVGFAVIVGQEFIRRRLEKRKRRRAPPKRRATDIPGLFDRRRGRD